MIGGEINGQEKDLIIYVWGMTITRDRILLGIPILQVNLHRLMYNDTIFNLVGACGPQVITAVHIEIH